MLCLDASRLSRNGRDWPHLLELCGLVQSLGIATGGVYDPCRPDASRVLGYPFAIGDKIWVLRLGRNAGVFDRKTTTQDAVVHAITAGQPTKVSGITDGPGATA